MLRKKTKSFRMTELQLSQLKEYLEKEQTEFSDFLHSLIQREIMQNSVTVIQKKEQEKKPRIKVKRIFEVIKRYQKTDPTVLVELGKIGNNLNQIARALNIIKNADPQQQKQLDILNLTFVLKSIQTDLQQIFPTLPKISRQSPERLKKQLSSIQLAEEDESAY